MEQLGARRAHNPKVTGSSPVPATREKPVKICLAFCISRSAESLLSKVNGNVKSKNAMRSEPFLVMDQVKKLGTRHKF